MNWSYDSYKYIIHIKAVARKWPYLISNRSVVWDLNLACAASRILFKVSGKIPRL